MRQAAEFVIKRHIAASVIEGETILVVGQWYASRDTLYRWRVLAIHAMTVEAIDSWGHHGTHNRALWENGDMQPCDGPDSAATARKRTAVT